MANRRECSLVWRDRPDDKWKARKPLGASDAAMANAAADKLRQKCPKCGRMIIVRGGKFMHHAANYERVKSFRELAVCR